MTDQDAIKTLTPLLLSMGWTPPTPVMYEDSSVFTEALDTMLEHLDQAANILNDPKWNNWMELIDLDHETNFEKRTTDISSHIETATASYNLIYSIDE